MPRTKRAQAAVTKVDSKNKAILERIAAEEKYFMDHYDRLMEREIDFIDSFFVSLKSCIKAKDLQKTMKELKNAKANSTANASNMTSWQSSTSCLASSNDTLASLNSTKMGKNQRTTKNIRSLSADTADEGYTSSSTRGTTSGSKRASRSTTRSVAKKGTSRSVSRTAINNNMKTPSNAQIFATNTGTITPKCKTNTPQVVMRRPKIGEMAWSNQGSPLMTGPVVADSSANVNIPLPDGNLVSLLPQRGVRMSQIPDFDEETRRQLEILRDNLIKVCGNHMEG